MVFVVNEVVQDKKWELSVPSLGIAPVTISGKTRQLFELFLQKGNSVQDISGYSGYLADEASIALSANDGTQDSWKEAFPQHIKRIREAVLKACGKDKDRLPYEKFLDHDKDRTRHYYIWKPGIPTDHFAKNYFSRDFREYAVKATLNRSKTESELGNFIDNVLDVYGELQGFFYRDKDIDIPFQFFEMKEEIFGRPRFPLTVKQGKPQVPNRGKDTLLRIRTAEKRHNHQRHFVYPGLIYRLLSTGKGGDWLLGQTVYTDLIESCDYLNFKIKAGWWEAKSRDAEAATEFLTNDPLVKEWADLVRRILKEQNFKHYLAGLAFSVPIFQVCKDKSLKIILAQDSNLKQADYGLHVAPAGMLEFSQGDSEEKTLSLENFQTIVAKELVEETLVGQNFSAVDGRYKRSFSVMESGPHEFGDPFKASIVRQIINEQILANWNDIWKNPQAKPSQTPLNAVLNFDPKTHPSFWIIDCFTLRPEIIMPVYIIEDLPSAFNWEVQENTAFLKQFSSWSEVTNYILRDRERLSAPGLAGLYFGAKHYFDTPDKKSLLSLPQTS
ncbi:MAG: hypothetical protein LBF38_06645 [Deltaproteobacteria bacterium]|jgi:hypothetical protein|nr:hypothetical protein [Deltaproteobacteria bacterium]